MRALLPARGRNIGIPAVLLVLALLLAASLGCEGESPEAPPEPVEREEIGVLELPESPRTVPLDAVETFDRDMMLTQIDASDRVAEGASFSLYRSPGGELVFVVADLFPAASRGACIRLVAINPPPDLGESELALLAFTTAGEALCPDPVELRVGTQIPDLHSIGSPPEDCASPRLVVTTDASTERPFNAVEVSLYHVLDEGYASQWGFIGAPEARIDLGALPMVDVSSVGSPTEAEAARWIC